MLRPTVKEPHRVSTSKANSLAGLCSRHEKTRDHFSPPRDKDKKKKEPEMVKKKAAPAPPVDFKALMKAAEDISQGKAARVDLLQPKLPSGSNRPDFQKKPSSQGPPRPPAQQYNGKSGNSSSSYGQKDHERDRERQKERERQRLGEKERSRSSPVSKSSKPNGSVDRNNAPDKSSKSAQNNVKKEEKQRKDGRFVKGPTPPPMIPGIVPGKKYLPGDVRYKEAMLIAQKTHHVETSMSRPKNGNSSGSRVDPERERIERVREAERARERERERVQKLKRERQREEMYGAEKGGVPEGATSGSLEATLGSLGTTLVALGTKKKERNRNHYEKQRKDDRSSGSYFRGGDDNTDDEDDEEDEYESDMDSFIDDSGDGFDDLERREFEETLRTVNRHYDTDKWSHREKTISERDMVSNYRRIQAEENYSKRAGMREDLIEATKGRSVRL
ncbi:unnamed protein product [Caenorhabditis auriculariae]|uniref:Protein SPT2 homolog n=1 Tax=Caenorhabditis auriculariae TaxID=2777116 RepID=A0A8S1HJJ7_9PELO|nr:unnamed protein product [Caenorhabditis auriculariae]